MSAIPSEINDIKHDNDDFKKRCRVCMKKKVDIACVFDEESSQIVRELEFCTGILMSKDDGLPISICEQCRAKLTISYEFKNLCIKSDELFRKLLDLKVLNKITIKKEEPSNSDDELIKNVKTEPIILDDDDDYDDYVEDFSFPEEKCSTVKSPKLKAKTKVPLNNIKKLYNKPQKRQKTKDKPKLKIDSLICERCELKFTDKESLKAHKKQEHSGAWICEVCGKQFAYRSSHQSHIRSHLPPQHKCDKCDYSTWHKADLHKHCRIHTGIKNFVCEYCTRSFYTTSNLHDHIRRHHAPRRRLACPRCPRAFHDTDKLKRHQDTHDNIKRFECELCHSRFSRRCQWKQHLLKQHNVSVPRIRPGPRKENLVLEYTAKNYIEIREEKPVVSIGKAEENATLLVKDAGEKIECGNPEESIRVKNLEEANFL